GDPHPLVRVELHRVELGGDLRVLDERDLEVPHHVLGLAVLALPVAAVLRIEAPVDEHPEARLAPPLQPPRHRLGRLGAQQGLSVVGVAGVDGRRLGGGRDGGQQHRCKGPKGTETHRRTVPGSRPAVSAPFGAMPGHSIGGPVKVLPGMKTLALALLYVPALAVAAPKPPETVSSRAFVSEVTRFLGTEMAAHVAAVGRLDTPPETVLGVPTKGDFTWGSFMRALADVAALTGQRTIAGRDVPELIGQLGVIEANLGGKSFAQLGGTLALKHYGANLEKNAVW